MITTTKNVDKLRSLPEDVLSNIILSLMPTKFAVRTSILSRSWRYSWTLVHNLDISRVYLFHNVDCFLKFMDRVFQLCKTTQLKLFRLHLPPPWVTESLVSKWIIEAIRLNVCEVDLRIRGTKLPISLFTCKTLAKLILNDSNTSGPFRDFPSFINLPNLKTLDISVTSSPHSNIFKVIHGCPLLENLSLLMRWRFAEEDYYFKIPTLKRLTLSISTSLSSTNIIFLNIPNVEFLSVDGTLCSLFVMENLSSLVEAKASCEVRYGLLWLELLKGISGAKYFSSTITKWNPSNELLNSPLPKFPNLKRLELKGYIGLRWLLIPQYFFSSSELEHVCVKKLNGGNWDEPKCECVPPCMRINPNTIKFIDTKGEEFDIQFLKFMLANSKVLQMLTVECDFMKSEKEQERLSEKLSMLPRASSDCKIKFVARPFRRSHDKDKCSIM